MNDILFRLQDFDDYGNTASERLLMRKEAYDEIARLRERNAEMLAALKLLLKEVELSGNADAKDYGWPAAIRATRAAVAIAEPAAKPEVTP